MFAYIIGLIGMWLCCDGILSLNLYINAPAEWREGKKAKQTWARDHWIRIVRIVCGITLIWLGGILLGEY